MRRLVYAAQSAAKVKLQVTYEPYQRYASSGVKTAKVSGDDLLDALKKMCDNMSLYLDSEYIEEDDMSAEEIIDRISGSNGDGCDFIYSIKDLTNGKILFEEDGYAEEDWDD